MVKVYMESNSHAELVAVFASEDMYEVCRQELENEAKKLRMIVTESLDPSDLMLSLNKTIHC